MSRRYTADTFEEAKAFIRGLEAEGHLGAELKERKAGKFIVGNIPWDGPKYQRFVSKFKARYKVRVLTSMMEQEGLL